MENEYSSKLEKLTNNFQNLILFSKKLDQEKLLINEQLQHFRIFGRILTEIEENYCIFNEFGYF